MSKGSLLCWLVLLQVCIGQLSLISSSQLTGGQIGDNLWCQDPIWRARLMSSHGRDEFDGHSADSILDEGVDTGDEYGSNDGGVLVAGGEAGAEEVGGLLLPYGDADGGDSGGTKDSFGDVECPECGKFFKNDKSMFGHLRSHPNRGYKGATPPVKKLKFSPDTAATASPSSSSPGTDRPPAQHSRHDPQLSPLEILCAYVMLTLKYRDNSQATQVSPPLSPSFGKLDAIGQAEGGIGGSVTGNAEGNAGAKVVNLGNCDKAGNLWNCDEHGDSIVKIPKKKRNMHKEVREAHRKKLVLTPKEKRPYVCKHCKAEFSTNQALGGHVAGHHREKKVPRVNNSSGMAAESQNGKQQLKGGGVDDKDLSLRRGLLSEQYSMAAMDVPWQSGQASGGQMMMQHSERRNDGLSPVVAAPTPTPTEDGDGDACRLLSIDLNVKAPEQE